MAVAEEDAEGVEMHVNRREHGAGRCGTHDVVDVVCTMGTPAAEEQAAGAQCVGVRVENAEEEQ